MVIESNAKPNFTYDSEEDDAPIVFRRSSGSSIMKQSQPCFSANKSSSSQMNDGAMKTCKIMPTAKVPSANSTPLHSKHDQSRGPSGQNSGQSVAAKAQAKTSRAKDSGDSDDDKPLSLRSNGAQKTQTSSEKMAPSSAAKTKPKLSIKKEYAEDPDDDDIPLSVSHSHKQEQSFMLASSPLQKTKVNAKNADDSEDEKPLLSGVQSKPAAGPSAKKVINANEKPLSSNIKKSSSEEDSDDDKPLLSRFQSKPANNEKPLNSNLKQNGSTKRPLSASSSLEPSDKKAKMQDYSFPAKIKKDSLKEGRESDESDHIPIRQRIKKPASSEKPSSVTKVIKKVTTVKKDIKKKKKVTKNEQYSKSLKVPPGSGGGQKWTTLEHNGVIFPPPYRPHNVKMLYNGKEVDLKPDEEEVATMFAVMKDTDYANKPKFIENFWNDWKSILGKDHVIKKFELCNFTPIYEWHLREKEKKKQMSSEEKKALKEEKMKQEEKYMWAIVDGVKEKVGNFRVEPPGLFRGRGEHPKMGKLKRRIQPKEITINIGKGALVPECPLPGQRWKEVRHDNTVTWLAFWNDPINPKESKYVFLAASSTLKGQSDKEKYEKSRLLKDYIHQIRANYTKDFTDRDSTKRQIAVATYLIDKLALRAGNEKDDDEADTVGCCTLKVENVTLVPPNKIQFDFLGKDSIRYFNTVEVELPVYKAIGEFQTVRRVGKGKKEPGDDLFDLLDTSKLNSHLKGLMPGLTAKVFRTYNASITLDGMLNRGTKDGTLPEKIAVYQQANKEVAIICNHQRTVSKSHESQMSRLNERVDSLKAERKDLKENLSRVKKGKPPLKDAEGKTRKNMSVESLEKKIAQLDAKIEKMEIEKKTKEDLKTIALGTSKINYLDPRITVAWCKRNEVPIEKIFNKSLIAKFTWAMDVDPDYRF